MKILHAASEFYPLVKTGGLADVLGALPYAQQQFHDDIRLVLPYYRTVREKLPYTAEVARRDTFAGPLTVRYAEYGGLGLYLLDAPHLYDRPGNPYYNGHYQDYGDNAVRFGLLGWAAAAIATGLDGWWGRADVLHAHDWQAGLAPAYLRHWHSDVRSVATIHNIAYQGMFQAHHLAELQLPWHFYQTEGLEFYGQMSFLKAGLYYADRISTVSPTYAREITGEPAACGMGGLLDTRERQGRLYGILNGIDSRVWNPAHDTALPQPYSVQNTQGKQAAKTALQQRFRLPENPRALLACAVTRLTGSKGADLLVAALHDKLAAHPDMQFVLLGSGDPHWEYEFGELARRFPKQAAAHIGYHEALAHLLIGGSDLILVPSRTEPCGLTQLYGLRYGTLPLVRRIGGLADTVTDTGEGSLKNRSATGFVFDDPTPEALGGALENALARYRSPKEWQALVRQAMQQDFGWHKAAENYRALYQFD